VRDAEVSRDRDSGSEKELTKNLVKIRNIVLNKMESRSMRRFNRAVEGKKVEVT
jgi:hypothetical protein